MNISEPVRDRLLRLVRMGLDSGVARLAQISGAVWQVGEVSIREGGADELRPERAEGEPAHFGAIFQMPGGVFLVSFPEASAGAVTQAFFRGFSKKTDTWKDKQSDAVAEISNMVVNPVANVLGDAALMIIFLSSPQVERGGWAELGDKAFERLVLREDRAVVRTDVALESPDLASSCRITILFNSALAGHFSEALAD